MNDAKNLLDRVFSRYIRHRDCPDGIGRCISCGARITPATCDCGHYIPRTHTVTRWNEYNCAAQCRDCNRYRDGNLKAFREALIRRCGLPAVEELERMKNLQVHLTGGDYRELTEYYTRRTAAMR